jgi:TrmH family RNA methyltransferase
VSTEIIRSRQNPRVKQLRAAFANAGRADDRTVAVEGEHLLEEALRSGLAIEEVFVRDDAAAHFSELLEALPPTSVITTLSADVFDSAVNTEAPQGIAAYINLPQPNLETMLATPGALVIVLDGVQDPGNVGTIVRSAEAFAATAVIALPGSASFWNGKTVRASAGSVFRVPLFTLHEDAAKSSLEKYSFSFIAATARDGAAPDSLDWTGKTALLIGAEGPGISAAWLARAKHRVTLTCPGPVESLNAAIAASLLLYEASKYRRSQP